VICTTNFTKPSIIRARYQEVQKKSLRYQMYTWSCLNRFKNFWYNQSLLFTNWCTI